jgi:molecular chaperone GrpE
LIRPLLKTLIDVHDALSLAYREAQRVQETVLPMLEAMSVSTELTQIETPKLETAERPFLAKLLGIHGVEARKLEEWQTKTWAAFEKVVVEGELARKQGMERVKQMLASLTAGYKMGLQRIERALGQHELEAIEAKGVMFDPERMEVLEAVDGSGRPSSEVLEEVRRGYLWRGRVFRYAQVRVARS